MVPFKVGENQYYESGRGPNVWDYYFEPVSEYTTGAATLGGLTVVVHVFACLVCRLQLKASR